MEALYNLSQPTKLVKYFLFLLHKHFPLDHRFRKNTKIPWKLVAGAYQKWMITKRTPIRKNNERTRENITVSKKENIQQKVNVYQKISYTRLHLLQVANMNSDYANETVNQHSNYIMQAKRKKTFNIENYSKYTEISTKYRRFHSFKHLCNVTFKIHLKFQHKTVTWNKMMPNFNEMFLFSWIMVSICFFYICFYKTPIVSIKHFFMSHINLKWFPYFSVISVFYRKSFGRYDLKWSWRYCIFGWSRSNF